MTIDFFDMSWNHQPFHEPKNFPFYKGGIIKPNNFKRMEQLSSQLAKGHTFLRVDWYEVNGKLYFGELTFFPTSGMGGFSPLEWDRKMGVLMKIPSSVGK